MKYYKLVGTPIVVSCKLMKEDSTPLVDVFFYKYLVDILMYLINIRLDIMFAVSLVARFMHSPHEYHQKAAKRIIEYILLAKPSLDYGIKLLTLILLKHIQI